MVKSRVTVFVEATSAVRRNAAVIDNGQHAAIMPTRQFSGLAFIYPGRSALDANQAVWFKPTHVA